MGHLVLEGWEIRQRQRLPGEVTKGCSEDRSKFRKSCPHWILDPLGGTLDWILTYSSHTGCNGCDDSKTSRCGLLLKVRGMKT